MVPQPQIVFHDPHDHKYHDDISVLDQCQGQLQAKFPPYDDINLPISVIHFTNIKFLILPTKAVFYML